MNTSSLSPASQDAAFDGSALAAALPLEPGVYRFYDMHDGLLYVGKAIALRRRVGQYFHGTQHDQRISAMVAQVRRIEVTVVATEADALVLEQRMIHTHKPRYNILLREGGRYPYVHVSTDDMWPQLSLVYGKKPTTGRTFGPFPDRAAARAAQDALQKHAKLRTCDDSTFSHRSRPCLEHAIGRCSAPCVGLITPADYREHVQDVLLLLDNKGTAVVEAWQERMTRAAETQNYEAAAVARDTLLALRQVQARVGVDTGSGDTDVLAVVVAQGVAGVAVVRVVSGEVVGSHTWAVDVPLGDTDSDVAQQVLMQYVLRDDAPVAPRVVLRQAVSQWPVVVQAIRTAKPSVRVAMARTDEALIADVAERTAQSAWQQAASSAQRRQERWADMMHILGVQPMDRIECIDISHTQGESTVASCVVFSSRGPMTRSYRRMDVLGVTGGDDPAAISYAVHTRLTAGGALPDVLLIDGGAIQLAAAQKARDALGHAMPLVGVSKGPERISGQETLVFEDGHTIDPGPHSLGLQMICAVRDEAHRFAIEGHRARRDARRTRSVLEDIPGLGAGKRRTVLTAMGGWQGIVSASAEQLAQISGIGPVLAQRIVDAVRPKS